MSSPGYKRRFQRRDTEAEGCPARKSSRESVKSERVDTRVDMGPASEAVSSIHKVGRHHYMGDFGIDSILGHVWKDGTEKIQ